MPRPRLRALRFVLPVTLLAVTAFAAGPVRAADPVDTTKVEFIALRSSNFDLVPGEDFFLQLTKWTGTGPFNQFAEVIEGTPTALPAPTWEATTVNGEAASRGTLTITDPTEGHHVYRAIFDADVTYEALTVTLEVDVEPVATSVTIISDVNPVQANHTATLSAQIDAGNAGTTLTGDLIWRESGVTKQTDDVEVDLSYPVTPSAVGVRHFTAEYTGDTTHAGSTSATFDLTATNDFVQASGVTIDLSNFYPYKDGYRDVVKIKGTRLEPASVAVSIYNSSNRRVRTMALPRAAGSYSLSWNGRSNGGTLQPAGKYRIVQVLTDAGGMKLSVTKYVNLSNKRIYYSTKYVTKNGSSISAVGQVGSASTTVSMSTGIARMRASSGSWTGAGYQFSLPSATVYKSISFQAYTKGGLSVPTNYIGIQNFKTCAPSYGWHEECFERWRAIGSSTGRPVWAGTSGSVTNNRTGRTARGIISVYYGTVYVYKVRMKVVVGVLK